MLHTCIGNFPAGKRPHRLAVAWRVMHRFRLSLHALPLGLMAQGNRVPTAEELNLAQPDGVPMLAERILHSRGGDVGRSPPAPDRHSLIGEPIPRDSVHASCSGKHFPQPTHVTGTIDKVATLRLACL